MFGVLQCVFTVFLPYSVFLQCVVTACCYSVLLQCVSAIQCLLQRVVTVCRRLCRLPQGFPAAALRLSLVSLSVDATRQPSAFIAHLAHTRSHIYMAGTACKHRGTSLDSGHSRQPCVLLTREAIAAVSEMNLLRHLTCEKPTKTVNFHRYISLNLISRVLEIITLV